jgi:predicted naringenin-chalcone synthase
MPTLLLGGFSAHIPETRFEQGQSLDWLAEAHAMAEAGMRGLDPDARAEFARRMRRAIGRFSCDPGNILARASVLADFRTHAWDDMTIYDLTRHPRGRGTAERIARFADEVERYFGVAYAAETEPPPDLIHVTCTGYAAPSGAQRLIAKRGWGDATRVTHLYHMGCYAALPALRIAAGFGGRVDIVHTELCTLHLDPGDHSPEQLVVQSLFADGLIRYALRPGGDRDPGLQVLSDGERIIPDSAQSMQWIVGDAGLRMTLARDIPDQIAGAVRDFVDEICARAGVAPARARFAIHPGGPKIIDRVAEVVGLDETQIEHSRAVLAEHGNMSSATLPHIWMRLLRDPRVPPGTPIVSLAFGPGLTIAGATLRKQ